jgi:hypothetical protein
MFKLIITWLLSFAIVNLGVVPNWLQLFMIVWLSLTSLTSVSLMVTLTVNLLKNLFSSSKNTNLVTRFTSTEMSDWEFFLRRLLQTLTLSSIK